MCIQGWTWTIVSQEVEVAIPELPFLVQARLNTDHAVSLHQSETEVLQTVAHLYQIASNQGEKPNLKACLDQVAAAKPKCLDYLGDHWPLLDQVWGWPRVWLQFSYILLLTWYPSTQCFEHTIFEEYLKHPVVFPFDNTFLLLRQNVFQVKHDWWRSHVQCHLPWLQGHNDNLSMAQGFLTVCQLVFAQNCWRSCKVAAQKWHW